MLHYLAGIATATIVHRLFRTRTVQRMLFWAFTRN